MEAVQDILDGQAVMGFNGPSYRASDFIRFNVLETALEQGRLRQTLGGPIWIRDDRHACRLRCSLVG